MPNFFNPIKHFWGRIIAVKYHFDVKLIIISRKEKTEFYLNYLYTAICNIDVIKIKNSNFHC